jgi:HEAT repeat protein
MISSLLDALLSTDLKRRLSAFEQVSDMDACDELITVLVRALADDNPEICEAAARALTATGRSAVEYLIGVLRDVPEDDFEEFPARWYAAAAIGGMGAKALTAVPDLIESMHDPNYHVQRVAALALGGIGPSAVAAIPILLDAHKTSHDPTLREFAHEAIQKIAPAMRAIKVS